MMEMKYYNRGQILVRNPEECLTFHAGDEIFNLLFISAGSKDITIPNYDDDGYINGHESATSPEIIDLVDGSDLGWGNHMVIPVDQFKAFVMNRRFMINATPYAIDAIKGDDFSKSYRTLQVCNAVIRCAKLYYQALNNGDIYVPKNIDEMIQDCDIFATPEEFGNKIKEIADIPMFEDVDSAMTRFAKRKKADAMTQYTRRIKEELEESNRLTQETAAAELRAIEAEAAKEEEIGQTPFNQNNYEEDDFRVTAEDL